MGAIARQMQPTGTVSMQVLRRDGSRYMVPKEDPFDGKLAHHPLNILRHGLPRPGLSSEVNLYRLKNLPNLWRGLWRIWFAVLFNIPTHYGAVFHRVQRGIGGQWVELGLASLRVVTTVGVRYICDDMNAATGSADATNFKYHGFGTGTTAEAVGDSALVTELTTEYVVNSTRPTGSQASATVSNDATYTTVGTLSPDSGGTLAITEHGIFSANAVGTLLDRSKFSAVNLVASSDSLQVTYVLTLTAAG